MSSPLRNLGRHVGSLFFIAAAAGSVVVGYVVERDGAPRRGAARGEQRLLPDFTKETLTKLTIDRGSEHLELVRGDTTDHFRVVRPNGPREADDASVDQLIGAIEHATIVRRAEGAAAGTDAPRARVVLDAGGKSTVLALGAAAPVPDGAAYLEAPGVGTVVVGRELVSELLRTFDAYRGRELLPDGDSLKVTRPNGSFELKRVNGVWRSATGRRIPRAESQSIAGALRELRATAFLQEGARPPAGVTPTIIEIQSTRLVVAGQCPTDAHEVTAFVEATAPVAACVPSAAVDALTLTRDQLVDDSLFEARIDEVAEIVVDEKDGPGLSLARTGTTFHQRRPTDRVLEKHDVLPASAFIERVLAVHGKEAPPLPAGQAPALRITVVHAGERKEQVAIFDEGGQSFAHREDDDAWLSLSRAERTRLTPPPSGLSAAQLLAGATSGQDVERVSFVCGTRRETVRRTAGGFAFEGAPSSARVDVARATELCDHLADAHAVDTLPAVTGPKLCTVTVDWTGDGGHGTANFSVQALDADAGGESVAFRRVAGDPSALVVSDYAIVTALRSSLAEPPPPADGGN